MNQPSNLPSSRERMLAAARREPLPGRPPGWVMRQAGRYLPEYRALREGKRFLEMVHAPEIAAELTCQPLRRFDMDAAVIFSDILVPPAAMGMDVHFEEGRGPVLENPVRDADDVRRLVDFDARKATGFLAESIRRVRQELGDEKAIVGFAGAPFTVASYMIEGGSSKNFEHTKRIAFGEPETFTRLLERIVDNQLGYLAMQAEAGADVLQVFDSWGGNLDAATWRKLVLPPTKRLIEETQRATGAPVILFVNGASHLIEVMLETGADVLGIDHRVDPADAIRRIGGAAAIQGNLDHCVLFAPPEVVARETERVLAAFEGAAGHIFNLGVGILPQTPVTSMSVVFDTLRAHGARATKRA
ncbi:MAG: uroporphyrinogen decarboxylase [Planctomycetota bacterium]